MRSKCLPDIGSLRTSGLSIAFVSDRIIEGARLHRGLLESVLGKIYLHGVHLWLLGWHRLTSVEES